MSRMERWIFIRHAESEDNVLGRLSDDPSTPLSARGRAQAEDLARAAAALAPAALWCSPLRRAQETAAPVAARLGLPIVTLDGLRERSLGQLAGRLRSEVRVSPDADALLAWWPGPPGGEGLWAAALRAAEALSALPGVPCRMVISHAGVLRALLGAIDAQPIEVRGALRVPNATPILRALPEGAMASLAGALRAERPDATGPPPPRGDGGGTWDKRRA